MSVSHSCFFDLARESLQQNGELWTRNAISRAYYGIYHSALRLTDNRVPSYDSDGERLPGGTHKRLYTAFCSGDAAEIKQVEIDNVKRIGLKLKMLHAQRVNADYNLERKIHRLTAISTLQDAEEINTLIEQMLKSPDDSLIA